VDTSSPTLSKTSSSNSSGSGASSGNEAMFGPFTNSACAASSAAGGSGSISVLMIGRAGSVTCGYNMPRLRGSVISPRNADAAAVSGLARQT
jgi:hypothetical protein